MIKHESRLFGILFGILAFWLVGQALNGFVWNSYFYYSPFDANPVLYFANGERMTGYRIFSPLVAELVLAVAISWLALKLWRKRGPFPIGRWLLLGLVAIYFLGYAGFLCSGYFDPMTIIPWGPRPRNLLDQTYWPLESLRHQLHHLLFPPKPWN